MAGRSDQPSRAKHGFAAAVMIMITFSSVSSFQDLLLTSAIVYSTFKRQNICDI